MMLGAHDDLHPGRDDQDSQEGQPERQKGVLPVEPPSLGGRCVSHGGHEGTVHKEASALLPNVAALLSKEVGQIGGHGRVVRHDGLHSEAMDDVGFLAGVENGSRQLGNHILVDSARERQFDEDALDFAHDGPGGERA
jgi:hypothetical protein